MNIFIASLIGGLTQAMGSFAGRVLVGLGFGVATYAGLGALVDNLKTQVMSNFSNVGVYVQWLGLLKVDVCATMILSAIATKFVLDGLSSGSFKRIVGKA